MKRDHELRKRAFQQFYAEFRDLSGALATSLAYAVKADVFHARARHSSALEAALFSDDVPIAVYDGLIQSVRANLKPLFRYFDLRRRALELRELHYYYMYVPLVPEIETRFTFDQAAEMVLGALEPLGQAICRYPGGRVSGKVAGVIATKRKANAAAPFHPEATRRLRTS